MKLDQNLISNVSFGERIDFNIDFAPLPITSFRERVSLGCIFSHILTIVKNIIDKEITSSLYDLNSFRLRADAYLNLCFLILKNTELNRSRVAASVLSKKSFSSQKTTRSSIRDFTKKISNLVRTPSIKRHMRGATSNSELWVHPTLESNITPRKLGLPKNRAESFFLRPHTLLRLGMKSILICRKKAG